MVSLATFSALELTEQLQGPRMQLCVRDLDMGAFSSEARQSVLERWQCMPVFVRGRLR